MFQFNDLDEPILATAIHAGHVMSSFLKDHSALTESERLYEEDPFTDIWAAGFPNHGIVTYSRFEIDLNRAREKAVYMTPDDAWGLNVWLYPPPENTVKRLLNRYDSFYEELGGWLDTLVARHQSVVVLDIHSYNHRRHNSPAPQDQNPDVNIGTGTMLDPGKWESLIRCVKEGLSATVVNGNSLDVRENVKFKGGHMAYWVHRRYPNNVCVLSLEFKKVFMDERTGKAYPEVIDQLSEALQNVRGSLRTLLSQQKVSY